MGKLAKEGDWPPGYYPYQVGGWIVHHHPTRGASLGQWRTQGEARVAAWDDDDLASGRMRDTEGGSDDR